MKEPIEKIKNLLSPLLEGTDMFLVNIKIKPTNNIKVYLDADTGLSISKSSEINRKLRNLIDETGMYPEGDFSLEVSSPGVGEPLRSERQYKKNIGRTVTVVLNEDDKELTGILKEVNETHIKIETKGTKKLPPQTIEIPISNIKTIIVQIVF